MKKRVLSLALAFLMLFSLSISAIADNEEQQNVSDVLEETINESNQNEGVLLDENGPVSDDDVVVFEPASEDGSISEEEKKDLVLDKENSNSDADALRNEIYGEGFLDEASAFAADKSSSVVLSDNLTLTDIKYQIIAGEMDYNPGSLGRLCITGTVTGSSSVVCVWIATWHDTQPSAETAQNAAEYMVSIWQENGNSPYVHTLPFEINLSRPIFAIDLGKTQYITLAGLDTNCNLVGYAVVMVDIPISLQGGLVQDDDGVFRYYENDIFVPFSGIVDYQDGSFFVANGVLCSDANGLAEYGGQWYFLANGQIQKQHTGLALYDGEWFYIENGIMNALKNGLVNYDGGQFLVATGRICYDVNGLWLNSVSIGGDNKWYFLSEGQIQTRDTGLAQYNGAWFYIIEGMLAEDFSGTVEYDGSQFQVVNGQVVF